MNDDILTFCTPELSDLTRVRETLFHVEQSDLAFPNLYLLRHKYDTRIAFYRNWLFRYYAGNGRLRGYTFPVGDNIDMNDALFHVEQHAGLHGNPLHFCALTEENARLLKERYGDKISFSDDPGDADYLYRASDLTELAGTAYHKKRNQISRFERAHGNWSFVPMHDGNSADALSIARAWVEAQEPDAGHEHELRAIENALRYHHELGLIGGLLYVENRPAALSLASRINDRVADIHYEKCAPDYRDAYPIICREMVRMMNCELVNREEDINIPGLRQAKLSWKPCRILHKLTAIVDLC